MQHAHDMAVRTLGEHAIRQPGTQEPMLALEMHVDALELAAFDPGVDAQKLKRPVRFRVRRPKPVFASQRPADYWVEGRSRFSLTRASMHCRTSVEGSDARP